jgi:hypothetical protein
MESKVIQELRERTSKEIELKQKQIERLKKEISELISNQTQIELQALYGFNIGDRVIFNKQPYIIGEADEYNIRLYKIKRDGTRSKRYNHLHISEFGKLKRSQP